MILLGRRFLILLLSAIDTSLPGLVSIVHCLVHAWLTLLKWQGWYFINLKDGFSSDQLSGLFFHFLMYKMWNSFLVVKFTESCNPLLNFALL